MFIPFILRVFGVDFLPSPKPFYLPVWSYWAVGIVISLPFSILFGFMTFSYFSQKKFKGGLFLTLMVLIFPFIIGTCANIFFGAMVPMLHTTIFGQEGHIEYKMRSSYDSYSRTMKIGCEPGVAVETKVIGHSILCGMTLPEDYGLASNRRALPRKGAIITVYGRASRAGVFYTSFEARPGPPPE